MDFWGFLLQTGTVSGVAIILLLVKWIFRDKLSPRWQFSVWGILGLSALIPAGRFGPTLLVDWPLWVETLKGMLCEADTVTKVSVPLPLFPTAFPENLWDWLYVLYVSGFLLCLGWNVFTYGRLRRVLRRGRPVDGVMAEKIASVEEAYHLKACKAVFVPGIQSAFVCGVFHPLLILPEGQDTDEKVLLHELLHLKYHDVVWSLVLCLFRCVHWCNPLLWYCANLVGNDMESLCDQRVLERLEGEARRDYGRILLSMTNEAYARTPGTSSAANGGKNIRLRIEAIARFKRYPKGMSLVSICIALVLAVPLLLGSGSRDLSTIRHPRGNLEIQLATARLTPCTTMAGALDAYAKAVREYSGFYRMLCGTDARQTEISALLRQGKAWEGVLPEYMEPEYYLYDVTPASETDCTLLMVWSQNSHTLETMRLCTQKLRVWKEGNRFVVEPLEDFAFVEGIPENIAWGCRLLPCKTLSAQAGEFQVDYCRQTVYTVDWETEYGQPSQIPRPDAPFAQETRCYWTRCFYFGTEPITQLGLVYDDYDGDSRPELPALENREYHGSSNNGSGFSSYLLDGSFENPFDLSGGGGSSEFRGFSELRPLHLAADLYVNGEKYAELEFEEERP